MAAEQLVAEGLVLMLVGMGTVFVFLTALVLAMHAMSRVLAHYPDSVATVQTAARVPAPVAGAVDARLAVVIGAAVHRHRRAKATGRAKPPA